MTAKVLIIDDEDIFREDLAAWLRQRGIECQTAANGEEGLARAGEFSPDVIFCDIAMPGKSGIEILEEMQQTCPESSVVMITAYGALETAIEAFRKGAADYILKPLLVEDVWRKIQRLTEYKRLAQEVKLLRRELSREVESLSLWGKSEAMNKVLELVEKVAATRSTVLITGESGTGKELVARAIHAGSGAQRSPFVAINCAGIPENLLESELFGHVRGAFTGAVSERKGYFEVAGEGAVLLDEIAEMPLPLQSKLLRVLEQKEFVRVGGVSPISMNARVITSTNKELQSLVEQGKFREDLFFRIAVFEIPLPPLRERRSDIPLLAEHFVRKLSQELKRKCLGVDNEAIRHLLAYEWPGNVRELRNVIERAMILQEGDYITVAVLPPRLTSAFAFPEYTDNLREAMGAYENEHIRRVLLAQGGNKEKTARKLGIDLSTLYRKLAD